MHYTLVAFSHMQKDLAGNPSISIVDLSVLYGSLPIPFMTIAFALHPAALSIEGKAD